MTESLMEALGEEGDLTGKFEAFEHMSGLLRQFGLKTVEGRPLGMEMLKDKQRRWAEEECLRLGIDTVPPRLRKPVPRGKEVPLAPVLQTLPKSPPKGPR